VSYLALFRHSDPTVQLYRLLSHESCGSADLNFSGGQGLVAFLSVHSIAHHGCIQSHATGLFRCHEHVDSAMLECLEGADRAAELLARLQIVDGQLQRARHCPDCFGAHCGDAITDNFLDDGQRTTGFAEQPATLDANIRKSNISRARPILHQVLPALQAGVVRIDDE